MDELTFLTLIITVGTIVLVYFGFMSWRSGTRGQRLVQCKDLYDEYLKLSKIIEIIRQPDYLRTDRRDLAVSIPLWSLHIREAEFEAISSIVRRNNPKIEPRTCDAWEQVIILKRSQYPSVTIVFEVSKDAFSNFERDVKTTLNSTTQTLRKH